MTTVEDLAADTTVIAGVVSTAPVYTRTLPDHVPHVSFRIDTAEGPGFNVHANGAAAELARITVHRRAAITVVPRRIYKRSPNQITFDIDVESIDIAVA